MKRKVKLLHISQRLPESKVKVLIACVDDSYRFSCICSAGNNGIVCRTGARRRVLCVNDKSDVVTLEKMFVLCYVCIIRYRECSLMHNCYRSL